MPSLFSLWPLIRPEQLGTDPITASLLYTDRIILGTEKGSLLIFDLSAPSSTTTTTTTDTPPTATFVARHDRFSRKQIDQLGIIKELNALVCLAGGDLTLHSLPDLSLLSSFAPQTKGAGSTFALHTEIRPAAVDGSGQGQGPPTIRTTLALACKRRLILLSWVDGTTWNPLVELALPHQIRGMAFVDVDPAMGTEKGADSTKLVAGFSTGEYGIVTLPTPDVKGAIKSPSLGDLFSLPVPLPSERPGSALGSASTTSTITSNTAATIGGGSKGLATGLGGGLRSLGGALVGGALARKLDKNGVAKVPRVRTTRRRRGTASGQRAGGASTNKERDADEDEEVLKRWLWEKEWGWNDAPAADPDSGAGLMAAGHSAEGEDYNRAAAAGGEVLVVRDNMLVPLLANGKQRPARPPSSATGGEGTSTVPTNSSIIYPSASTVEETLVSPPYILSLVAPSALPPSSNGSSIPTEAQPPPSPHFTLEVHTLADLKPVQSLAVPPEAPSPPASIAASSLAALHHGGGGGGSSTASVSRGPTHTARLLTLSSTTPKPPLLVLTSKNPSSSAMSVPAGLQGAEQTLWVVSMKSWPEQIEELGREGGRWEEGIELMRGSWEALQDPLPPALSRRLATLHALYLFRTHRYALAIDAFIALDLTPANVVALYPESVSGKLCLEWEAQEELFGGRGREETQKTMAGRGDGTGKEPAESGEAARDGDETGSVDDDRKVEEDSQVARSSTPVPSNAIRPRPSTSTLSSSGSSPARTSRLAFGIRGITPATTATATANDDNDDAASIRTVASRFSTGLSGKRSWLRERERDPAAALEEIAEQAALNEERQAKREAENRARSIDELIRYLTDRRQKYSRALASLPPHARPSPSSSHSLSRSTPSELFRLPNAPLTKLAPEELARVAQVVDTALFRTYLATRPVMIGPLCRIENWCEVEEVEELLLEAKKYRELLDLYNGKNMNGKAVELLKRMSAEEDDPEEKVGPTVRYLQKLGADHLAVILEASRWVFAQDTEAGLQIFVADLDEVESLPRHKVMAHLESVDRVVCIRYLEHVIHQLGEQGADFHEKLIDLYLQALRANPSTRDEKVYKKLLDLLETSTSYRADRILGRLPSEDMHEARALLLGRLGRHEGALQIYVYQLEDHVTAEQYCKRVYDSDPTLRSNIFHTLLRIYLRPRPDHPVLFSPALSLLSTHAARIDAVEAFELLPPLVALEDIQVYLTKTLRRSVEKRREAKMVRAVGKSAVEKAEREVVDLEERRVKITEGRLCPVCHKRIGTSVIAIHNPRGEVTHYQCREQFTPAR
ncbi:hypothetical protein JCM10908_001946 [Rhodotorula pacifica]|uniref:Vam6p n=1 Tax=Rhodotorula pacifica TaxID=1495444 RepID=UPI003173D93A